MTDPAPLLEDLQRENAALRQRIAELEQSQATLRELSATDRTAELQAANRRLTELNCLKDDFLSRIIFELRTPLATIRIYIELLKIGKPDQRDKYLQTLQHVTAQLHRLIEDMLAFAQFVLDAQPDQLSPLNLNDIVESHCKAWQSLSTGHNLQFQLNLTHDLPRSQTDSEWIGQAVNCLVLNAINYTPTGSVTVSTALHNEAGQHWVTISVIDTGPGITPADLPHIFKPFYRGRAAANDKTPGTGIGLTISRAIAEKLGGRLTVETQVGVGSTFTLWLRAV